MSIINAIDAAGSGILAQSKRLEAISSNIANMDTVAQTPDAAFKAKLAHFKTIQKNSAEGVVVDKIIESEAPVKVIFMPDHPMADENGYVYGSNVNREEQVADMVSAQTSYELNVQTITTLKNISIQSLQSLNK